MGGLANDFSQSLTDDLMINQLILTSLELVAPEVRGSGESSGRCVASAIVSKPMGSYGNGARAMLSGPGVPTGLVGVLTVVLTVRLPHSWPLFQLGPAAFLVPV